MHIDDTTPPEHGTLKKIADDIFWARFELPFRLNHINIYILDEGDGWMIIDCGVNNDLTAAHWKDLLAGPLASKPVTTVLVTHHHPDHLGYAAKLVGITGAKMVMSRPEYDYASGMLKQAANGYSNILLDAYTAYGFGEEILEMARNDNDRYSKNVGQFPDCEFLKTGDTVKSAGGEWVVRTDCGHSIDQIGMIDRERKVYIAGDFLLPRISPNVSVDPSNYDINRLGEYIKYLNDVSSLPDDMLVLPGHDWPFYEGGKRAQELIKHHEMRLGILTDLAADGPITVSDGVDALFGRKFSKHEVFFAGGESHAHLLHLVVTGRMTRSIEEGVIKFALA